MLYDKATALLVVTDGMVELQANLAAADWYGYARKL